MAVFRNSPLPQFSIQSSGLKPSASLVRVHATADAKTPLAIISTVLGIAGIGFGTELYRFWHPELTGIVDRFLGHGPMAWTGSIFLVLFLAELTWRICLVYQYRPVSCPDRELLPKCTVVVPAFNEGAQVYKTLQSLAESDYPKKRLQLIAVDDGSQDDTWEWICRGRQELGRHLTAIRLPRNKGKRHALYAGFRKSTGDILVTVDSDSMVEPETIKHLVAPFVKDAKVGAVAGNVRVLNLNRGLIPRMLEVVFTYSFDFVRASQSMVNTVLCTPGALSAYRRRCVMHVLQEWLHQTYCGRPATIGEDRAMTNLILRQGYHVVFQQNAVVYTEVPVTYSKLCKMYLRWDRSNVRETLAMTRFAFRRFRKGSMIGARINLVSGWLSLIKTPVMLVFSWIILPTEVTCMAGNLIAGTLIFQSFPAGLYVIRHRSFTALWSYVYGLFWFTGLFWIRPWALVTSHRSSWLTRHLVPPGPVRPVHGLAA